MRTSSLLPILLTVLTYAAAQSSTSSDVASTVKDVSKDVTSTIKDVSNDVTSKSEDNANDASTQSINAIPACFLECSGKAAKVAKCQSTTDLPCVCVSDAFLKSNAQCSMSCPEAADAKVSQASFNTFATICKQAVGDKFNLTMPTNSATSATDSTTSSGSSGSVATNTTSNPSTTSHSSSTAKSDGASSLVPPAFQHIITGTFVFSVLLGGAAFVF